VVLSSCRLFQFVALVCSYETMAFGVELRMQGSEKPGHGKELRRTNYEA
jgi:hypothetical protein